MNNTISENIRQYKIVKAFWAAAQDVMKDHEKQVYLLMILGSRNNVVLLKDDADRIKSIADQEGNPYMAYAYARLHDFLNLDEDSPQICKKYYGIAANCGIGDAYACLAYMYRDGDFGESDMSAYEDMMDKAIQYQSEKAYHSKIIDMIHGRNHVEKDPEQAYNLAEERVEQSEIVDPVYYKLMGDADVQLGRTGNAMYNYERAAESGCSEAFFWWAVTESCDLEGTVIDRSRFMEIMQQGINVNSADCFIMRAMTMDCDLYDSLDEDKKIEVTESLFNDLNKGYSLGDSTSSYLLGQYYQMGNYGFEQDDNQAWSWYKKGAALRCSSCYEELARMVLEDGTAPADIDLEYGYECAYKALLLGNKDVLEFVVRGYKYGFLSDHSSMIEEKWKPEYEQSVGDLMDDHEIDSDEYNDDYEYLLDVEPEREIGEDDCRTINVDIVWKSCCENVDGVEHRAHNQENEWEIAGLIEAYLNGAEDLLDMSPDMDRLNDIYGLNNRLLDIIIEHPRLKLRLMKCQLNVLHQIEAHTDRDMNMTDDLQNDIFRQEQYIALADAGRQDEIPQTGHLKHDPVEWTARWEAVIDKADEIVYRHLRGEPRGMGFCFSFWSERKTALAKFGIEWRTPHQMNPRVLFD